MSERKQEFEKYKRKKEALEESILFEEMKRILKGLPLDEVRITAKSVYPTISRAFDDYVKFKELKPGSKNNYRIAKNVLVDFSKVKYRKELTIEQVDYKFVVQFVKYLREERPIPNQQNTVAKRLKLLKTVLRFSNRIGKYNIEDPFTNYPIELGKHKEVALSKEEYSNFKVR